MAHAVISPDLQAALGNIQWGAEERLEILKEKKRQLEKGEVETKLVLIGHVELDEGERTEKKMETEEPDYGTQGKIPPKQRVTQSITALRDAKRKENITMQEQRWMELTKGHKSSTTSASLGEPMETVMTSTTTSAVSSVSTANMATATISSTTEGEPVDLQVVLLNQGDEDDDTYGKKYKTTSEDRMDRNAARARQKEEHEKQERERAAM